MIYVIPSLSCVSVFLRTLDDKIERESESVGTAIVRTIRILKAYLDQDRSTIQKHDVNVNLIFLLFSFVFVFLGYLNIHWDVG